MREGAKERERVLKQKRRGGTPEKRSVSLVSCRFSPFLHEYHPVVPLPLSSPATWSNAYARQDGGEERRTGTAYSSIKDATTNLVAAKRASVS